MTPTASVTVTTRRDGVRWQSTITTPATTPRNSSPRACIVIAATPLTAVAPASSHAARRPPPLRHATSACSATPCTIHTPSTA